MSKAFLSHSSANKTLVDKIANQLGRNNCHQDRLTFEAGGKTIEEIFRTISDSDVFILFISEPALQSDWVKKEITFAKAMLDKGQLDRIFPIIIDKSVTHKDERIPVWIRKPYNLKFLDNEVLIHKKITQILRDINLKKFSHLKQIDDLFVGRHDIMQEFERSVINADNFKPTVIFASSFFDGVGRRTFIKNGLRKTRVIDNIYDPLYVSMTSKESIEDFIYKLSQLGSDQNVFDRDLSEESLSAKISLAIGIVKSFYDNGEIIFIIDEGSIVLPNTEVVEWFARIVSDAYFNNKVAVCVISKFKPSPVFVSKSRRKLIAFRIPELSREDTRTLLLQYLNLNGIEFKRDDIDFFLSHLSGIPDQVIYANNLINSVGVELAKKKLYDIEEFAELKVLTILDFLKDDELSTQIIIALSKFDLISYNLLYRIFGENDKVYEAVQKLFDLSVFDSFGAAKEYIKLSTAIADYISRSRLDLNDEYNKKLKLIVKEALETELKIDQNSDYSEFLLTLQSMIKAGKGIPKKYFLPSFILKTMVSEYFDRRYNVVVQLAKKILEKPDKFDYQIIRETRYWLCLAYCRSQDETFFELVEEFAEVQKDYNFLMGFYFRNSQRMEEAEGYYLKVLDVDPDHSRTKRELVLVYQKTGDYSKALKLARDNYEEAKTNILHNQAYFACLIRKYNMTEDDKATMRRLIQNVENSLDKKSREVYRTMKGEYEYYVNNDLQKAISFLEEVLKSYPIKYFAFRSLSEIYRLRGMTDALNKLHDKYPNLHEPDL
jgi:Tfp pilus assembly protein PilF